MEKVSRVIVSIILITVTSVLGFLSWSENATARINCETEGTVTNCRGGEAHQDRLGGHGGNFEVDTSSGGEFTSSGGFGSGNTNEQGGFHCEGLYNNPEGTNCVGSEDFD